MKIALACGGTGGHLFPGLATAEVLRQRGHNVELWVAGKDIEAPALKAWSGPVHTVPAEGLPHGFSPRTIRAVWTLWRASKACAAQMKESLPAVLLGMGCYASVGPTLAARRLGIPVVLHESNVLPGRAIRLISRGARVAINFEETRYYLHRRDLIRTGMPIRRELVEAARAAMHQPRPTGALRILVMGGSRGARRLNELAAEALSRVHTSGRSIVVTHLTGVADEAAIRDIYARSGVSADVASFTHKMASIYAAADLVLCRAGASTCEELSLFGLPALLVPYPFAVHDHQTVNARALERQGAADVALEKDLTSEWLTDFLMDCQDRPERLERQRAAARERATPDAAERLATVVEEAARQG